MYTWYHTRFPISIKGELQHIIPADDVLCCYVLIGRQFYEQVHNSVFPSKIDSHSHRGMQPLVNQNV